MFLPVALILADTHRHALTHINAGTQLAPPLGVALINELKVQRCLCLCGRYMQVVLYSCRCIKHARSASGQRYFLSTTYLLRRSVRWLRGGQIVRRVWLFPLPLGSLVFMTSKKGIFWKQLGSIGIASGLITCWCIGYWSGHNEDVNDNATFPRTLGTSEQFPGSHDLL